MRIGFITVESYSLYKVLQREGLYDPDTWPSDLLCNMAHFKVNIYVHESSKKLSQILREVIIACTQNFKESVTVS